MIQSFEIAPGLQGLSSGKVICCVAIPVCVDHQTQRHLLATVPQHEQFVYNGILPPEKASYSLLRVVVQQHCGSVPVIDSGNETMVSSHPACDWRGARQIIELCCGMGALGHGAKASGFNTVVGCDIRPKMLELFQRHSEGKPVLGDICEFSTLRSIYEAHPFSCAIASGIACQPYSQLGDQKGGLDPRASTLPATLSTAFYLRAMVIVIECVGPAKDDPFVQHHIRNFCLKTGFRKSECLQDLKDIWASKRSRWWCVLTAPAIGVVDIAACGDFPDIPNVGNLIPQLCPWPTAAEEELTLTPHESEAFQPSGKVEGNYLLNTRGPMACALHCWASQLSACPCGCRDRGLSKHRLAVKGLFGVLVESVRNKKTRHIHPQEAGALCGLDPCLSWGDQNRLALCGVGQLASPLQSLWIFSHILQRLQVVQHQVAEVSPKKMMMAYRSWLLARCVKQWGNLDMFPPSETLDLSRRWVTYIDMTFQELLSKFPVHHGDNHVQKLWERVQVPSPVIMPEDAAPVSAGIADGSVTSECPSVEVASLGEGVDHGLTLSQVVIDSQSLGERSPSFGAFELEVSSVDEATPSVGPPSVSESLLEDIQLVIHGETGEVDLSGSGGKRALFRFEPGCTVEDLIIAESSLQQFDQAGWEVFELSPPSGSECEHDCRSTQISVQEPLRLGMKCRIRSTSPVFSSDPSLSESPEPKHQKVVHPEVEPHPVNAMLESSVTSPLMDLAGKQFLKLTLPVVCDPFQASSLLSQMCPSEIRVQVLSRQAEIWADDEIRWHLARLQFAPSNFTVVPIEPMLMHGWIETNNTELLGKWLQGNVVPEALFVTAVLQAGHWFPICLECRSDELIVSTWDLPNVEHIGVEQFCQVFASSIDLRLGPITQHSRLFAGEGLCGAASIAFIEHKVIQTQLPEFRTALESLHQYYRQEFIRTIENEVRVTSPWLWGAGNDETFDQAVTKLTPLLVEHGVPGDHVHHRAAQAVKAIGVADVLKAVSGKTPWKSLKTLGTNVRFQFILPDELQAQISRRAGKEAVGKPMQRGKVQPREPPEAFVLDPTKLTIPEGSFVGGGKPVAQIPLSLLGPLSEGIVIATWQQAEPYLRTSQILAKGPLAMLVLHGPMGGCSSTLAMKKVTVPARCSVNNEPLLLEALLVQLGGITVSRAVSESPVSIDTVKVSTMKLVVFKDECWQPWEEVTAAPMKYIINNIPVLKLCKKAECNCPHWHNPEKVEATEAIVDVWRRQFLRAGYKPEPVVSSTIFSVCIRVPECLAERLLGCSGGAGIYLEPRSLDSKSVSTDYEVVWVPKAGLSELCHLRQVNPAVIGIARVNERYGLRVRAAQAAALHQVIRPDAVYLSHGTRQQYVVGPIPYGTDRKALSKALGQISWEAKPLQPVSALSGERGVMWAVVAVSDPPTNILSMSHGDVVITKAKEANQGAPTASRPVAAQSTISLCGTGTKKTIEDPWIKADPWGQYVPTSNSHPQHTGLTAAAESIHQLESKIESAVLAKLPQCVAMDQDDVSDRVHDLENRFNQMMHRQQQLESVVQEQGAQQGAQLGQMQSQINAQGQQLAGHMDMQQQQIQNMFESQMAQIRGLLSKRPRDSEQE